MPMLYTEIRDAIEAILQDPTNLIFSVAELDVLIPLGLSELSWYKPRHVKETLTTIASKDLTLSTENKRNLLWVENLEYKVDEDPREFRNFTRWGDIVTIDITSIPTAGESVYLYLAKKHILQKEVGASELTGTIKTEAAAGASCIVVTSLGTGTVRENTQVAVEDDTTPYTVIADATISGTDATIYITPVTSKIEAVGKVVTLSLSVSTLDPEQETLLADLVASKAASNKAVDFVNAVNIGGVTTPQQMLAWGNQKLALTLQRLRAIAPIRASTEYPKS